MTTNMICIGKKTESYTQIFIGTIFRVFLFIFGFYINYKYIAGNNFLDLLLFIMILLNVLGYLSIKNFKSYKFDKEKFEKIKTILEKENA